MSDREFISMIELAHEELQKWERKGARSQLGTGTAITLQVEETARVGSMAASYA